MTDSIFEIATRSKARFESLNGMLTVEQLWDLPLTSTKGRANLDDIAKHINKQIREASEESFVGKESKETSALKIKLDVVKHIIKTKLDEASNALKAEEKRETRKKIIEAIEAKKDQELVNMSVEELKKKLDQLD